jgi:hypothetical protein
MKALRYLVCLLSTVVLGGTSLRAGDAVTVDANTTCQTIRAWGAPTGGLDIYADPLIGALFDEMVFSMGLNRARLEPRRRGNDNAFTTPLVASMLKTLAPRLETLGIFNGEAQNVRLTDPGAQGQPRAFYRVLGATP